MNNYAMVAINRKEEKDGMHIRRVLISYTSKETSNDITTYKGTKLITVDPYFEKEGCTHKYIFKDDGYRLVKVKNNPNGLFYIFKSDIYRKRKYHSQAAYLNEFEAATDGEAIEQFISRAELK